MLVAPERWMFLGDCENGRAGFERLLILLGAGGDLDVHQVFSSGLGEVARGGRLCDGERCD
jgi:hypothetical protein